MNVQEIQKAVAALAKKVGPKGECHFHINSHHIHASIYTMGMVAPKGDINAFSFSAFGDDAAAILADLEAKWLAEKAARSDRTIEQMALSIIRLTAEFGECTDAALRAEYGPLVAELSEAATERANSMAAKGPFSITSLSSANAA